MNLERSGEILLAAVVISALAHFGMMTYARQKVMTRVSPTAKAERRGAMRVTKAAERPEAVKLDVVPEVDALAEAPVVEEIGDLPPAPAEAEPSVAAAKAVMPMPLAETPGAVGPKDDLPAFDVKPLSSERSSARIEVAAARLERPRMVAPVASPGIARFAPLPTKDIAPLAPSPAFDTIEEPAPEPAKIETAPRREAEEFRPAAEVREKVDEQLVEQEKAAVKDLLSVSEARELRKAVNAALTQETDGAWTYFTLMLSPRHELPVVAKDVVILIDASGSIGRDRIRSVREAAKGILRTCTNSGDRFNLVAFRDKFTYAFRRWQDCTRTSFDQADRWLDDVAAHGRTDVFDTISSVLALPRDPKRPLIALVITDGDANFGVSETSEILSKFTALNDGLISVYMYGVKGSANRELIDVLTCGNRGESFIYDGWLKWKAGSFIDGLGERFRDPVLSDLKLVFAVGTKAEAYPRRLKNLYRGETLKVMGRVPAGTREVAFTVKGLNGADLYEGFFKLALETVGAGQGVKSAWEAERQIDLKLR